jgi:hypothetical protein
MAFHHHARHQTGRLCLTIGVTAGNLSRLDTPLDSASGRRAPHHTGPIEFEVPIDGRALACVLRLDKHPLPHPARLAITLTAEDVAALLEDGLVDLSRSGLGVVVVYGLTPVDAGEAVRRVLEPALPPVPDDPAEVEQE